MNINESLDHAVRIREFTPGRPEDGPYPATVEEVADEVVAWIRSMSASHAPGLVRMVREQLTDAPTNSPAQTSPSGRAGQQENTEQRSTE